MYSQFIQQYTTRQMLCIVGGGHAQVSLSSRYSMQLCALDDMYDGVSLDFRLGGCRWPGSTSYDSKSTLLTD